MTIMRSCRNRGYLCRPMKGEYINFIIANGFYPDFIKFKNGFEFKAAITTSKVPSQNRLAYLYLVHKNLLDHFHICREFECKLERVYEIAKTKWLD